MDKSYTHIGSHDNLLGKDASAELETEFSNEKQVTKETPRAFIAYSDDDKTVPPANGVNYYLGLHKNHVQPYSIFMPVADMAGVSAKTSFTRMRC